MNILLFLAKGFETMEASVFVDVMGWARNDFDCDVNVITCGLSKTVVSTFGVPVTVDTLLDEVKILLADQNNLEDARNIKRSSITGLKQRMEIISVMM